MFHPPHKKIAKNTIHQCSILIMIAKTHPVSFLEGKSRFLAVRSVQVDLFLSLGVWDEPSAMVIRVGHKAFGHDFVHKLKAPLAGRCRRNELHAIDRQIVAGSMME
jgi:hypothetical protein